MGAGSWRLVSVTVGPSRRPIVGFVQGNVMGQAVGFQMVTGEPVAVVLQNSKTGVQRTLPVTAIHFDPVDLEADE